MRYVGYAWRVLIGLIELAVVWALVNATHTKFEEIVVGGLIVIYASVLGSFKLLGRAQLELATKQWEYLIALGKLLNDPNADSYSEVIKEQAERTSESAAAFWINVVFNSLVGLIGFVVLFLAAINS